MEKRVALESCRSYFIHSLGEKIVGVKRRAMEGQAASFVCSICLSSIWLSEREREALWLVWKLRCGFQDLLSVWPHACG